jgi:hypothetical protein
MSVEGFWTAEFGSSVGIFGGGVVFLQSGKITGGDSAYVYAGEYTETKGGGFTATIEVSPFIQGTPSVFNTVGQKFTLELTGAQESEGRLVAQGRRPDMPGVTFGAKLTRRE